MSKKKNTVYKPRPISGFPEWLPEERFVEQQWFDHIRSVFESYGFCSLETPSVEELDVLAAKGEVDKEIYVIERLHKEDEDSSEARLALHFDQTVPLARYVAQHFNELDFPFKRYQSQRVWRGERPQAGRFREFYQCDIDVIHVDNLPLHFDAEMPAIMWEVLSGLPGVDADQIQLQVNNRKILLGLLSSIYLPEDQTEVLRVLDKREKLKAKEFEEQLANVLDSVVSKYDGDKQVSLANITNDLNELFAYRDELVNLTIKEQIVKLEEILKGHSDYEEYQSLKSSGELPTFSTPSSIFYQGLEELIFVMKSLSHLPENSVVADFFMVRGLDYYTGTVYETVFKDDPTYGSICSGGRYDDLAGSYINRNLPGVGISLGFSRLFDYLRQKGQLPAGRKAPTDILVVLPSEEQRPVAAQTAQALRQRGYNVELYHSPQKIKKQLSYAEKKGISYVWFPPFEAGRPHEVKNMTSGAQDEATPETWERKND